MEDRDAFGSHTIPTIGALRSIRQTSGTALARDVAQNSPFLQRYGTLGRSLLPWPTIQEASDLLWVPVSWLYESTRTNSVPHVKLEST